MMTTSISYLRNSFIGQGLVFFGRGFGGWLAYAIPFFLLCTGLAFCAFHFISMLSADLMPDLDKNTAVPVSADKATLQEKDMRLTLICAGLIAAFYLLLMAQKFYVTRFFLSRAGGASIRLDGSLFSYFWNIVLIHVLSAVVGIIPQIFLKAGTLSECVAYLASLLINVKFFLMPPLTVNKISGALSASWTKTKTHYGVLLSATVFSYIATFAIALSLMYSLGWMAVAATKMHLLLSLLPWRHVIVAMIGLSFGVTLIAGLLAAYQSLAVVTFARDSLSPNTPTLEG